MSVAATLPTSCGSLPPEEAGLAGGGPALRPLAVTLDALLFLNQAFAFAASCHPLPSRVNGLAQDGLARRPFSEK